MQLNSFNQNTRILSAANRKTNRIAFHKFNFHVDVTTSNAQYVNKYKVKNTIKDYKEIFACGSRVCSASASAPKYTQE